MLRVAITTLGCKANRADADALLSRLGGLALEVPFESPADLYIVNSCTVTAIADRQSRQMIYRARRRNPEARIVLTGCLAALTAPGALREVDRVIPLARHGDLVAYARRLARQQGDAAGQGSPHPGPDSGPRPGLRARPFLKVQDGCDARCSYCIVPLARGPSTSLPPPEVLSGLRSLAGRGFPEVVLSGIHLGCYGRDLDPPTSLAALLERLRGEAPRLRLSSIEPLELEPALTSQVLDPGPEICPHLHVPIQSGDDRVLAAMGRPYRVEQVLDLLSDLRRRRPDLALGADLMVGFPGETEQQARQTLELVQRAPLTHLHVFRYSPRPGTPAAELRSALVPGDVSRRRAAALREAGQRKQRQFAAKQLGQQRQVVVETHQPDLGTVCGLTDNYLRVTLPGEASLVGQMLWVELEQPGPGAQLRGRAL